MQVMPDGRNRTGCFTADFTLHELSKLRATQSLAFRDQYYDGKFRWPHALHVCLRLGSARKALGSATLLAPFAIYDYTTPHQVS